MYFSEANNNKNLIRRLEQSIVDHRISHAYIFEGLPEVRKEFAFSFVKAVCCRYCRGDNCGDCVICDKIDHGNYEDILYIEKDGNSIKDSLIVSMQEKLNVKPFGDKNIVIIDNSEAMTLRAQNRLLKVLEEPPGDSLILLLTDNMEKLIQTILSRCVKYRIHSGPDIENEEIQKADAFVRMLFNREPFYRTKAYVSNFLNDRDQSMILLDHMEIACRNLAMEKPAGISLYKFDDIYHAVQMIEEARVRIQKGYSTGYTLKNMILKISKF